MELPIVVTGGKRAAKIMARVGAAADGPQVAGRR
jgi:hypothetical protein